MDPLNTLFQQSPPVSHLDPIVQETTQRMVEAHEEIVGLRFALTRMQDTPLQEKNGIAVCLRSLHSVPPQYCTTVEETEHFFARTLQKVQKEFQRLHNEKERLLAAPVALRCREESFQQRRKAPLEEAQYRCGNSLETMIQHLIDAVSHPSVCPPEKAQGIARELSALQDPVSLRSVERIADMHSAIMHIRESVSFVLSKLDWNELELLAHEFDERIKELKGEGNIATRLFSVVVDVPRIQKMPEGVRKEFLLSSLVTQLTNAKDFYTAKTIVDLLPEGNNRNEALASLSYGFATIREFEIAIAIIRELPEGNSKSRAIWRLVEKLADAKEFSKALEVLGLLFEATTKEALILYVSQRMVDDEKYEWAFSLAKGLFYDAYKSAALRYLVERLSDIKSFEWAKIIVQNIPDEHVKSQALRYLVDKMADEGKYEDAHMTAATISLVEVQSSVLRSLVITMVLKSVEHIPMATAIAETISLESERRAAIEFILSPTRESERVPRKPKRGLEEAF